jgi:hypothetical protein
MFSFCIHLHCHLNFSQCTAHTRWRTKCHTIL